MLSYPYSWYQLKMNAVLSFNGASCCGANATARKDRLAKKYCGESLETKLEKVSQ
jgi:hypothetical protein